MSLVARSLKWVNPKRTNDSERGFGRCNIDSLLTADQLAAVAKAVSRVKTEKSFIGREFVTQFGSDPRPAACVSAEERLALLTRIFAFATEVGKRSSSASCGEVASTLMCWCMHSLLECDGKYNFAWFNAWITLNHAGYAPFVSSAAKRKSSNPIYPTNFESIPRPDFSVRSCHLVYSTRNHVFLILAL